MSEEKQENQQESSNDKKVKILTVVNQGTGEIEARIKLAERTFGKKRWLAMFQDNLMWLSKQDMTGEQLKVMLNMFSRLEFDNYLYVKTKDIAESLGIHPKQASRALRVLKEKEIIYEDPNHHNVYKLNPYIGHKGTKNYSKNVTEFEKMKKVKTLTSSKSQ